MAVDPARPAGFGRLKAVADSLREQMTVKRSLSVAKKRQQYMLPRVPDVPGYEFTFLYHPAEHVSGDFLDIVDLGEARYGILIGDVSGHGFEAGLIMGAARKALQIYARSTDSPTAALNWANDDLLNDLDSQTFLTVCYAVLDTRTGSLQFARAGHTHPLLLGPARGRRQALKSNGTPIGVTRGEKFTNMLEEVSLEFKPGQILIQYTDGIVEAHDGRGEEFGVDRFVDFLEAQIASGKNLGQALEELPARLSSWAEGSPQEDDITVLAVRRMS